MDQIPENKTRQKGINARRRTRWILGGTVVAVAVLILSTLNMGDNIVYFYTPAEAVEKSGNLTGTVIRVGGMVKTGTVDWQAQDLKLKFVSTDFQGNDIVVHHSGTPPDMFKEGQGVIAEGVISADGKSLQSRKLMVKHSEEYRKPENVASMDKELLQKSILGTDGTSPEANTDKTSSY